MSKLHIWMQRTETGFAKRNTLQLQETKFALSQGGGGGGGDCGNAGGGIAEKISQS
jgi:hypothetical protein